MTAGIEIMQTLYTGGVRLPDLQPCSRPIKPSPAGKRFDKVYYQFNERRRLAGYLAPGDALRYGRKLSYPRFGLRMLLAPPRKDA